MEWQLMAPTADDGFDSLNRLCEYNRKYNWFANPWMARYNQGGSYGGRW